MRPAAYAVLASFAWMVVAGVLTLLSPIERYANRRKNRDGDGCYHVFLDVGANLGVHGRFLFEPSIFPASKGTIELFDNAFGSSRDNRDFCSFEIEPNPVHRDHLAATSNAYQAMGWRYYVMSVAAGDEDGIEVFNRNVENDVVKDPREEIGFSSAKRWFDESAVEHVATIRLASWIDEHINQRKIPPAPHGDYGDRGPKVLMKMDIEGSEFVVLPDLLTSGAMCGIDTIFGEFHHHFAPLNFTGQRVSLETAAEAAKVRDILKGVVPLSRNCKTQFMELDDESYLHDKIPLPSPQG